MHDGKIFAHKGFVNALGIVGASRRLVAEQWNTKVWNPGKPGPNVSEGNAQNKKGKKMKYRGHETFSIRKNWLAKGIEAVSRNPGIFMDKSFEPMDELGIGRNMVVSLRYWMRALHLVKERKNLETKKTVSEFTKLGKIIKENDKYVEEAGTLWLLQAELASERDFATSWYFFFNEFNLTEFTKEDFVSALKSFDQMNSEKTDGGKETALSSFESDFECIVNTYVSRFKNAAETDPEDNIESPFAELGLVDSVGGGRKLFRKVIPPKQNIPPLVFLALLYKMAGKTEDAEKAETSETEYKNLEIPLSDIQNKKCGAGKLLNLDVITLMDILSELETRAMVKVIRTAGLDVVRLEVGVTYEECVRLYYKELN